jgi:hypothetical protein
MRKLLSISFVILLAAALLYPQDITVIRRRKAAAAADVTLDSTYYQGDSGNTTWSVTPTLATGLSNRALVLMIFSHNSAGRTLNSVSGAGATWSQVGSTITGNESFRGYVYVGIAPTGTGAQTITVTFSGDQSGSGVAFVYHVANAGQTTDKYTVSSATSGNLGVSIGSGELAVSGDVDSSDTRTVSGCTSTRDVSGYASYGYASSHCSTSPTSTFTWNAWGTNSLAIGVAVAKP